MVERYQRQILRIAELLRRLENEPSDLDTLETIQNVLVGLITKTEGNISRLRGLARQTTAELKTARRPRSETAVLRKRIETLRKRIDEYQYLKFIWKCFGDGIPFIYLDKYALKHTFYDTTEYLPKQDAGALSGKAGLKRELSVVRQFKDRKIPAVLCDITNTLRYGDVCVLVGPDPISIEVKSSNNDNSRVERQLSNMKALGEFFRNDEARDFRGLPYVTRIEFVTPEVNHLDALNRCIDDSEGKAMAVASPEPGLQYLCIRQEAALDNLPSAPSRGTGIFCLLNEAKTSRSWAPYFPFTLSIRDPRHIYAFVHGDISLAVLVDGDELRGQFLSRGLQTVVTQDGDWAIAMRRPGKEGISAVSRQLFGRVFYEFQSLAWFVTVNSENEGYVETALTKQAESMKLDAIAPDAARISPLQVAIEQLFENDQAAETLSISDSTAPIKRE